MFDSRQLKTHKLQPNGGQEALEVRGRGGISGLEGVGPEDSSGPCPAVFTPGCIL